MQTRETLIFPKQEQAIELWKVLVEQWFMFMWEWVYNKWYYTYQVGYDPDSIWLARKLDMGYEKIWTKKQKKLYLKAQMKVKREEREKIKK